LDEDGRKRVRQRAAAVEDASASLFERSSCLADFCW
jgi:hypothetical protein